MSDIGCRRSAIHRISDIRYRLADIVVIAVAAVLCSTPTVAHGQPTYTKHIAPILQQNCQQCHQPGSIAPMSLLTYDDAKKYSTRIKNKVSQRLMPPWHIDRTVGIQQFKNDRSLTDAQVQTIVDWVNAGSPLGDPKDMPPAISFPDPNRWQLAEKLGQQPDLVLKSKPYTLAARTQDKWFRPVIETGVTEPRWGARDRSETGARSRSQNRAPCARLSRAG